MREDCFAYKQRKNGTCYCNVLTKNICESRSCPFYKTPEDYVKGFEGYSEYEDLCRIYGVKPKK